ncbi:hypothetical protein [Chryseobacterium hispalense]|uniref:hypothetical protein n=1 Tax=Chryseobacterium hispalense TaxID=1453492 RepID=UPI00391C041B
MENKYPHRPGLDFILKQAFFYWNKTLVFQLMFSIMYFGILMTVFFFCDARYNVLNGYIEAAKYAKDGVQVYTEHLQKLLSTDNFQNFSMWMMGTNIFLYPLNLGFYQIYRKMDLGEKIVIGDLFAGYNGINFFKYIGYYIFWYFIFAYSIQTIILGVVWVCITMFVAPMMFFMNKSIFESIALHFKALKMFSLEILVCIIVAIMFKYVGFLIFFVGGLFTFPFWNAMIYSLYKVIFSEKD